MAKPARDTAERFWEKVDKSGGVDACWPWLGKLNPGGYGLFTVHHGGQTTGGGAHRWAYRLTVGEIPEGHYVLHSCDNPPCVNPAHLSTGDQFANMRDASGKGRLHSAIGPRSHCPKGHELTPENTRYEGSDTPCCRICKREQGRRGDAKRRRPTGTRRTSIACRRGHPWTPETTYLYGAVRLCRICRQIADVKRRHSPTRGSRT